VGDLLPDLGRYFISPERSGLGGTGKSLLALQLAASTALDRAWLGLGVRSGKAVYLSAEDDKAELHRRLADIAQAESVTLADLGALTLRSLAGEDALLALLGADGALEATPLLDAVDDSIRQGAAPILTIYQGGAHTGVGADAGLPTLVRDRCGQVNFRFRCPHSNFAGRN